MLRLTDLMKKNKISQYRLAKDLDAPISTVNSWLRNKAKSPRDFYLNQLAEYFKVHPAWLRYGDIKYAPRDEDEIHHLLLEAEQLGVKEDGIAYLRFRIQEVKKLKHESITAGRKTRHKIGK